MSAHSTLTLETFRHILSLSLNAHVNTSVVVSWMVMEPKINEIGYAASIAWPMNASQDTQDKVAQAAQSASALLREKGYRVPEDVRQSMTAQAIQIDEKTAHGQLEATRAWMKMHP